jgi:L-ascorbate metabolism protein UlaG (beta-lactamase superfamily)
LSQAGWAIKTQNKLLIFDYIEEKRKADEPSLWNGHIIPEELKDQNVYVFVTHGHNDHFNPAIFQWKKSIKNIRYIFGFEPKGYSDYTYIKTRDKRIIDGMEIHTIKSTDAGVGFLVKVDGLTFFHAGDHANRDKNLKGPFPLEIDYLAGIVSPIDMAFVPITGCGFRDPVAVEKGVRYIVDKLKPKILFPMHADGNEYLYKEFAKKMKKENSKIKYICAENRGDWVFIDPL